MAPLTWQTVATPDFRGSMDGLRISNDAMNRAFAGLGGSLDRFQTYRKDQAESAALTEASRLQDPVALREALMNGSLFRNAGVDPSLLGREQFGAFDKMVSERIRQAGGLEDNAQALRINPLKITDAQNIIRAQNQTYEQKERTNPIEVNQALASLAGTRASTAGTLIRNASGQLALDFDRKTYDPRLKATNSGYDRTSYVNQQATTNDQDVLSARDVVARIRAGLGPNAAGNGETLLEGMRSQLSPGAYALAQNELRGSTGSYGGSVSSPSASGRGTTARGQTPTEQPPVPDMTAIPEDLGETASAAAAANRRRSVTAGLIANAAGVVAANERATGVQGLTAAQADNTPLNRVVDELRAGKDSLFGTASPEALSTRLQEIKALASAQGITISNRTAGLLLADNFNFDNTVWSNTPGVLGSDVAKNPLQLNEAGIKKAIARIKGGNLPEQETASRAIGASVAKVQAAQAKHLQAVRALQELYRQSRTRPDVLKLLPQYQREVDDTANLVDRFTARALQTHPELGRVPNREGFVNGMPFARTDLPAVVENGGQPVVSVQPAQEQPAQSQVRATPQREAALNRQATWEQTLAAVANRSPGSPAEPPVAAQSRPVDPRAAIRDPVGQLPIARNPSPAWNTPTIRRQPPSNAPVGSTITFPDLTPFLTATSKLSKIEMARQDALSQIAANPSLAKDPQFLERLSQLYNVPLDTLKSILAR